jgi:hypothetical protein
MTAMVNAPWPPVRVLSDPVLPSPQVRLGNPRELVDVKYQASNLAHRAAKSIERRLGSSSCFVLSVIAGWWGPEPIGFGETVFLDPTLHRHPEDSTERNKTTTNVS